MAYVKTTWINGSTPLNATNLNHLEQGVKDNDDSIIALGSSKQDVITPFSITGSSGTLTDAQLEIIYKNGALVPNSFFYCDSICYRVSYVGNGFVIFRSVGNDSTGNEIGSININLTTKNWNRVVYYSTTQSYVDGQVALKQNLITAVTLTGSSGTLDLATFNALYDNKQNYIINDGEWYKLSDDKYNDGFLVYTHTGQDSTNNFYIKCITITISTLGWVKTSKDLNKKLYRHNIRVLSRELTYKLCFTFDIYNDSSSTINTLELIKSNMPQTSVGVSGVYYDNETPYPLLQLYLEGGDLKLNQCSRFGYLSLLIVLTSIDEVQDIITQIY